MNVEPNITKYGQFGCATCKTGVPLPTGVCYKCSAGEKVVAFVEPVEPVSVLLTDVPAFIELGPDVNPNEAAVHAARLAPKPTAPKPVKSTVKPAAEKKRTAPVTDDAARAARIERSRLWHVNNKLKLAAAKGTK